jgi:hypothetical protein
VILPSSPRRQSAPQWNRVAGNPSREGEANARLDSFDPERHGAPPRGTAPPPSDAGRDRQSNTNAMAPGRTQGRQNAGLGRGLPEQPLYSLGCRLGRFLGGASPGDVIRRALSFPALCTVQVPCGLCNAEISVSRPTLARIDRPPHHGAAAPATHARCSPAGVAGARRPAVGGDPADKAWCSEPPLASSKLR